MKRLASTWAALVCALLAGCATLGSAALGPDAPGIVRADRITPAAAQTLVAIGKSGKADVQSALGDAAVVKFDSGFEVWVYRWPGAQQTNRAATEFVVLFDPSGVVKKTRLRPGYGPEPKQ